MPRFTKGDLEKNIKLGQVLPGNRDVTEDTPPPKEEEQGIFDDFGGFSGFVKSMTGIRSTQDKLEALEASSAGWVAGQALENPIVAGIDSSVGTGLFYERDPEFNAATELEKRDLWKWGDDLVFAANLEEFEDRVKQKEKEEDYYKELQGNGYLGYLQRFAGAASSPSNAFAAVGSLHSLRRSANFLKGIATGSAYVAGAVALDEAALRSFQLSRSQEESFDIIVGGATLGAVLGGAIGSMTKPAREAIKSAVTDITKGKTHSYSMDFKEGKVSIEADKSMGAAERSYIKENWKLSPQNLPDTIHFMGKEAPGPLKAAAMVFRAPSIRGLAFKSPMMKEITWNLLETPLKANMVKEGFLQPTAAETVLKRTLQKNVTTRNNNITKQYVEYVKTNKGVFQEERAAIKGMRSDDFMSPVQFSEEAVKSARRGGVSDNPHVAKAAKEINVMIKDATDDLLEAGLLTEKDLAKGAQTSIQNYYTRVYNKAWIRDNYSDAITTVKKGLTDEIPEFREKMQEIRRLRNQGQDVKSMDVEFQEGLDEAAQEIVHAALGMSDRGALEDLLAQQYIKGEKPGFLKDRTIELSDAALEPLLMNDITVATRYATQAHTLAEFKRTMDKMGFKSIDDFIKNLEDEHIKAGKELNISQKELEKSKKFAVDMMETFIGFRHQNGDYDEVFQNLKKFQVLTLLGAVTISSFPDLAMNTFKHGPLKNLQDGIIPLATKVTENKELADEWGDLILALNGDMSDILSKLFDPVEARSLQKGRVSKAMDIAVDAFSKSTGFTKWNSAMRISALRTAVSRTLRAIDAGKTIKPKEAERLLSLGLDAKTLDVIKEQFKNYGKRGPDGNGVVANFDKWRPVKGSKYSMDDIKEAMHNFQDAMIKEVDSTNILPGRGDVPLGVQNNVFYSTIFQFKSFMAAATNKILLSSINRADKEVIEGLSQLIATGAAVYVIKRTLAGKEVDMSPENLLLEGVARSGAGGFLAEVPLAVFSGSSRYTQMNLAGMMAGPTFSNVWDLGRLARSSADIIQGEKKEFDKKDEYIMRRNMILQNHVGIQAIIRGLGYFDDDEN